MKSIGNERLQSLKKRVRAVLLSGALTATLVLSNMAGIFTEAVYAASIKQIDGDISTSDSDFQEDADIIIESNSTITIDSNKTIRSLKIKYGVTQVTIVGDNEHKLTCSELWAEENVPDPSKANLIINSGKLVCDGVHNFQNVKINGGTVEVKGSEKQIGIAGKNITINGGTVIVNANANGIDGREKVTISGGTVKTVSSGDGIFGLGGVEITGGNIDVTSSGGHAIGAWGNNINISGQSTVIKAVTNAGYSAIQASNGKINISSPLGITSPTGGGISGDGRFIATSAGGNQGAKAVEIKEADTSGATPDPAATPTAPTSTTGKFELKVAPGGATSPSFTKGSGDFEIIINDVNGEDTAYGRFHEDGRLLLKDKPLERDKDYTIERGSLKLIIKSSVFDGLQAGVPATFVVDFGAGETMNIPVTVKAAPQGGDGDSGDSDYSSSTPVETVAVTERKAPKTGEV